MSTKRILICVLAFITIFQRVSALGANCSEDVLSKNSTKDIVECITAKISSIQENTSVLMKDNNGTEACSVSLQLIEWVSCVVVELRFMNSQNVKSQAILDSCSHTEDAIEFKSCVSGMIVASKNRSKRGFKEQWKEIELGDDINEISGMNRFTWKYVRFVMILVAIYLGTPLLFCCSMAFVYLCFYGICCRPCCNPPPVSYYEQK